MKKIGLKKLLLALATLNLTSCLFDQTVVGSSSEQASTGGSGNMSLYVKFSDVTTCTAGKILTYDGSLFSCVSAGVQSQTNITTGGSSYIITDTQDGVMFTYNDSVDGTVSLPALSTVSNGFQVTIARQVSRKVLIQTNGADSFPNGTKTLEMQGKNLASVSLVVSQGKWQLVNQTDDCEVGKSCWGQNNIYLGTLNGHQYFTTPGNCTDSVTPTCDGNDDQVTKAWANNSGTTAYNVNTGALNTNDGKAQSAMLATTYTDTDAAQYCENMTYAGYSDWYLPAKMELDFLYRNKANITGLKDDWNVWQPYWSSTEYNTHSAWIFFVRDGSQTSDDKSNNYLVRCVRRF